MEERIPQGRLAEPPLDALPVLTAFWIALKRGPSLFAENELDLAKLMRLKAAARLQPVTKRQEVEGRDRLEHIDLRDQGLENRQNALERGRGQRRVVGPEQLLQVIELVQHFLEPQLVDLMDDDEEGLVMLELAGTGRLERQELVELQIVGIGDGHSLGL